MNEAREVAGQLSLATGVECVVLDVRAGREGSATERTCTICESRLTGHQPPTLADPLHRFAAYQSERLGAGFVYVCGHTLLHIAVAITHTDALDEVLVMGPMVLGSGDTSIFTALQGSPAAELLTRKAVTSWIDSLPAVSPSRATALSRTASRIASGLSSDETPRLADTTATRSDIDVGSYLAHLISMEGDKHSQMPYPIEAEADLRGFVSSGNREAAQRVLAEMETSVFASGIVLEEARSRVLELVVLLSRAAIEGGANAEHVFGLEYRSLQRLREMKRVRDVQAWLERIVDRFVDLVFDLRHVRFATHISAALAYVRDHYHESVSLSAAAEYAGVSAGHLGRIFAREMRTTFSRHVQAVRMQEAKRMLRDSTTSIGDIGAQVGIQDHSYFTSLFRKETGLSPSQFRDRAVASSLT